MLAERGVARIVGADIDADTVAGISLPGVELDLRVVERGDNAILGENVDVVSPNATGGVLNASTIPTIRAPLVCGAANNQLGDDSTDDRRLADAGILYLPDFLVNRMGIVTCADEASGYVSPDPAIERHLGEEWDHSIYRLPLAILDECAGSGRTPAAVALERAEAASFERNPIHGHRGAAIIESLARNGWAD
jgi:glutamate dehydrogenase/leucine dehydrogenase